MVKKILSFFMVISILISCFLVSTISASALSQADLSFTVNGNGTTISILDMVSGNGAPVSLGSSSFTVNSSNYAHYGWVDSANDKVYYSLVVSLPSQFSFHVRNSVGSLTKTYTQDDLGNVPSSNLLGFIVPMVNGGSIELFSKSGTGNTQRLIYLEFDVDDTTPAPDPDPDPDDPYIETDSNFLFNIYYAFDYAAGIMIDGASRVFYYDIDDISFRCGFDTSNHAPIIEMSGHVKKYKVTLYNVPDGTFLSFSSNSQLTTYETDSSSSEYTYIVNSDSIPNLSLSVTYSDDQDDIWETFTILIEIRDSYAQAYYQGYDDGYDDGYEKAIEDMGNSHLVNDFIQVITNPVRAVMSFQLADLGGTVITIGNVFYTVIGIFLIIAFLKMFAGG